ncbi:MAG TPA: SMP-30/gluconolactonase/LRE family protein [Polyangia bacterium]|nr:SMP-30/gluconolactonase/LRE family protein [Polyangia bacterium]
MRRVSIEGSRRFWPLVALALAACHATAHSPAPASASAAAAATTPAKPLYPTIGAVERLDPALDALIAPDAKVEKLAEGFTWAEGPVWTTEGGGALLFSDVPNNVIHRWKDGEGVTDFLKPSGYTNQKVPRGGNLGSNGLTFDGAGHLILCQHGDRRIARLEPDRSFATVAGRFEGRRFNSPNDVVVRSNGDVYFTDPPYGFEGVDPKIDPPELHFAGVYHRNAKGVVKLLTKEMKFPNGIAFSPDEKILYVSNSDPDRAIWMAFDVKPDGGVANGRLFFDATAMVKAGNGKKPGLPDGMKIDEHGNLFAGGPGGVLVFSPAGKHLGTIVTGEPTANVAFGPNESGGSTLYMTAHDKLCRIHLETRAASRDR